MSRLLGGRAAEAEAEPAARRLAGLYGSPALGFSVGLELVVELLFARHEFVGRALFKVVLVLLRHALASLLCWFGTGCLSIGCGAPAR